MEDETRNFPVKDAQSFQEPNKKQSKIAYTRSFLLSLSELDVCKELPSGFDQSILSEFEDAYGGLQDRQRNHGNLPLQSLRRMEYGSSPPTRGDSNSYKRGYGRWDNNSGSWNDKDSDTQTDRDSETGRCYGNLSRRSSQTSEHDGLLGSGSFPRTSSGFTAGLSASKSARPNDHYQLNKSTEPYHPPRSYKAVPHGRKETKDSYNDETFGSSENTSQDKMEDERRRRASFELMRKEQHKSLKENQKQDPDKHRDGQVTSIYELLDDTTRDLKRTVATSNVEELVNIPAPADSSKSSLLSQVSRPRVPPGFNITAIPEKESSSEVGISKVEESFPSDKAIGQNVNLERQVRQQIHIQNKKVEKTSADLLLLNNEKQGVLLSADSKSSSIIDASVIINGSGKTKYDTGKMTEHKASREMKQDDTSILEKIFGTALMLNMHEAPDANELPNEDDGQDSADVVQSSKFAHWFIEDENKTKVPSSDVKAAANNLLSLIGVSDNKVCDAKAAATTRPQNVNEFFQAPETTNGNKTKTTSLGLSNQGNNGVPPPPKVLTCEDLEHSILSEFGENGITQKTTDVQPISTTGTKAAIVDNGASQHLLSLLQKGKGLQQDDDVKQSLTSLNRPTNNIPVEENNNSLVGGKSLTLETLFGSAFMEELQSVNAPLSAQRLEHGVIIAGHENDALLRQQTKRDDFDGYGRVVEEDSQQMPMNRGVEVYKDEQQPPPFGHRHINFQPPFLNPLNAHINQQQQSEVNSMEKIRQDMMHQLFPSHNHHQHHPTATSRGGGSYDNRPFLHLANVPQLPLHMQRGVQPPPHHHIRPSGLVQEANTMHQGFPFQHRPNFSPGLGMHHNFINGMDVAASTGSGNSNNNNHSEAMKRLIEMEIRANAKMMQQQHHQHHPHGMFGHDLDLGGYRHR